MCICSGRQHTHPRTPHPRMPPNAHRTYSPHPHATLACNLFVVTIAHAHALAHARDHAITGTKDKDKAHRDTLTRLARRLIFRLFFCFSSSYFLALSSLLSLSSSFSFSLLIILALEDIISSFPTILGSPVPIERLLGEEDTTQLSGEWRSCFFCSFSVVFLSLLRSPPHLSHIVASPLLPHFHSHSSPTFFSLFPPFSPPFPLFSLASLLSSSLLLPLLLFHSSSSPPAFTHLPGIAICARPHLNTASDTRSCDVTTRSSDFNAAKNSSFRKYTNVSARVTVSK